MSQYRATFPPGGAQACGSPARASLFLFPARPEHPDHRADRQQIGGGIDGQGHGRSRQGQQPTPEGRTHQLADVEDHREAGQVRGQFLGAIHQQGAVLVAGRQFEAAGHSHQQGAQQQQQHLGSALQERNREGSETAAREQGPLGADQHPLAAQPVGGHPSRTTHQQGGQCQGSEVKRQEQGIAAAIQEDPAFGGQPGERACGAEPRGHKERAALVASQALESCPQRSDGSLRRSATMAAAPTTSPCRS